jgi:hypothetical protein
MRKTFSGNLCFCPSVYEAAAEEPVSGTALQVVLLTISRAMYCAGCSCWQGLHSAAAVEFPYLKPHYGSVAYTLSDVCGKHH